MKRGPTLLLAAVGPLTTIGKVLPMLAPTNSSVAPGLKNSSRFVSIGRASKLLGCSIQSLREWQRAGKITAYQTVGNHRRFLLSELQQQALGVSNANNPSHEGRRVAIYCRCSTRAQSDNLRRQQERLLQTVAEREGIEPDEVAVYSEIASSFNDRPKMNRLVSDIVAGKIAVVYSENRDRFSRVNSLTTLITHLAQENNTRIVFLDKEEIDQTEMQAAILDLTEFITVICNRLTARKAADRNSIKLTPESLEAIRRYAAEGLSIRDCVKRANADGHKTEKGEPLSYRPVQRVLNRVISKMPAVEVRDIASEFWKQHTKYKKWNRVQAACLHIAFCDFCRKNNLPAMTANKFGRWMKDNCKVETETKCGYTFFIGIEILGYASVIDAPGVYKAKYDNGIAPLNLTYLGRGENERPKPR